MQGGGSHAGHRSPLPWAGSWQQRCSRAQGCIPWLSEATVQGMLGLQPWPKPSAAVGWPSGRNVTPALQPPPTPALQPAHIFSFCGFSSVLSSHRKFSHSYWQLS